MMIPQILLFMLVSVTKLLLAMTVGCMVHYDMKNKTLGIVAGWVVWITLTVLWFIAIGIMPAELLPLP